MRRSEEMKSIEMDVKNASTKVEEPESGLQAVIREKYAVLEAIEKGRSEVESMIICYYERVLEKHLKDEETPSFAEDLRHSTERLSEFKKNQKRCFAQEVEDDTGIEPGLSPSEELTSVVELIRESKVIASPGLMIDSLS
ncbi:hypothetical protein MLD38_009529 [Melastoma candidum]|uniref:Uncharacterized protein n=1 Tax=Melastoma candidum TaxID=119954 RepID=A0ACB9RZR4_9MYRT|nr:hypothetical protein MLD38_009529 [Melastoma candidum]